MKISIVICCYNSESRIIDTLSFIENQNYSLSCFEVVIVNNNSEDKTRSIIESYQTSLNIRVVDENKPGLMNARIKGIKEANNEIIIFVDDDNWLDPNYLSEVALCFKNNKEVTFCSGVTRLPDGYKVDSFFDDYFKCFAVGSKFNSKRILQGGETLWGAGLSVKRDVLLKFINYDFKCLGRSGGKQLAGDDTELCLLLRLNKYEGLFNPELKLQHSIQYSRFTKDNLIKTLFGFGAVYPFLINYIVILEENNMKNKILKKIIKYKLSFKLYILYNLLKAYFNKDKYKISALKGTYSTLNDSSLWLESVKLNRFLTNYDRD
ncbi:glycosyltransferase [Photobacterium kishitanii]|uniref:Glycosyltransferase 2-like domain-containing protein n=1 Tax=Photobacterium kishitanii TaxID=318456 RepID=A0A2T3KG25_9GAMM|nr:glycosyltransferase family 2 protein [Photobacterium kishitanii]PSU97730.1 hypothetical protein C9J27_15385 [Photobacterium kishitanii]